MEITVRLCLKWRSFLTKPSPRTLDFQYMDFPFESFNPPQQAVLPHYDKDCNLVVSLPTASGKTAIAEVVMSYELATNDGRRVIYTSPLKSLSSEKNRSWSSTPVFRQAGVVLRTGDFFPKKEKLDKSRVFVSTYECLDSRTRWDIYRDFFLSTSTLIVDEAHILGEPGRGAKLETMLMRASEINPSTRLILLSATMTNSKQIAKWVKSLNGKETFCVVSKWRPTPVDVSYISYVDRTLDYGAALDSMVAKILERVKPNYKSEKILIFVHSKFVGRKIIDSLVSEGIRCGFHHAGVSYRSREKIEKSFSDPDDGINVLVSTSTLAMGVNLEK